jgi:hypothetical protein
VSMLVKPPRRMRGLARTPRRSAGDDPPKKAVGRPTGAPSTMVHGRIPRPLWAQLDRPLDRLEGRTRLQAHRGMIARRALELLLASHASDKAPGGEGSEVGWSSIPAMVEPHRRGEGPLSHITGTRLARPPDGRLFSRESAFFTRGYMTSSELNYCLHNSRNRHLSAGIPSSKGWGSQFYQEIARIRTQSGNSYRVYGI